jgi:hypothetical protein
MNIRPIIAFAFRGVFIKQLPGNTLICHNTLKDTRYLGWQMIHLSVNTKHDSFFKSALLHSKRTTSESAIEE